jgi:hypothetical protein
MKYKHHKSLPGRMVLDLGCVGDHGPNENFTLHRRPQEQLSRPGSEAARAEYGPTQYDIRDIFSLTAEWEVPFDTWYRGGGQAAKLLGEGWRTTLMVNANTGLPTNINQRRLGLPSRSA